MRERVNIADAKRILEDGGAVIIDTDTVAGIAVSAKVPEAIDVLYKAKSREAKKPVAWLVSNKMDLLKYGKDVPEFAKKLSDAYWPGSLTLVVKASPFIDSSFVAEDGTIGLRMPDHEGCIALSQALGCALATTSANISGMKPPKHTEDVDGSFAADVAVLESVSRIGGVDDGEAVASTVVDCTGSHPTLIREGTIPFSDILINAEIGVNSCE